MNALSTLVSALFLFLSVTNNTYGQWVPTNGPEGGEINCFLTSVSDVFAGTSGGGVFMLTDNNSRWTSVSNGLVNPDIWALAADGNRIYAATDSGVSVTTNNGTSWTTMNNGLPKNWIRAIFINGTDVFVYDQEDGGIYRSEDSGAHWSRVVTDLNLVFNFASSGKFVFASGQSGLFRSTDNGANWEETGAGDLGSRGVSCVCVCGTNVFAIVGTDIFVSTDMGTSWTKSTTAVAGTNDLVRHGTNFFAATTTGVFVSTDCGLNWMSVNSGISNPNVWKLFAGGNNLLAMGTNRKSIISTNDGASWNELNTRGLLASMVTSLVTSGTNIFASTGSSADNLFRSTDDGDSWGQLKVVSEGSRPSLVSIDLNLYSTLGDGSGVYRSTDQGDTWSQVNNGLTTLEISFLAVCGPYLLAVTNKADIFSTTDEGANWQAAGFGMTNHLVSSFAACGTNIFASALDAGVYIKTNDKVGWKPVNNGLTPPKVVCLAAVQNTLFAATYEAQGLFKSSDNGSNWVKINSGLKDTYINCLFVNGTNLFVGTYNEGVYLTTNNGVSWINVSANLPDPTVQSLAVIGSTLYAGTGYFSGHGVWKRPLTDMVTVSVHDDVLRQTFKLEKNYPNPFTPQTRIEFSLLRRESMTIVIYDVNGTRIRSLVSNEDYSEGTHDVMWDGTNDQGQRVGAGVYFARMQAGKLTATTKMSLIE